MSKVEITANFLVWVPDGDTGRDKKVELTKGMVLDEAGMPAGQSMQDWIAKDLARDATPKAAKAARAGNESAQEAGAAV